MVFTFSDVLFSLKLFVQSKDKTLKIFFNGSIVGRIHILSDESEVGRIHTLSRPQVGQYGHPGSRANTFFYLISITQLSCSSYLIVLSQALLVYGDGIY